MFRFDGSWYTVKPKLGEPERQTHALMWKLASGTPQNQAYREWYARERKITSVLYPNK
jgi:hypothetical protein